MTPSDNEKKDFFVSYTEGDREWAAWIAWTLDQAGYSVEFAPWDFRPGEDFIEEMNKATRISRQTLAVLSPGYLDSDFTQQEMNAALVDDPRGSDRKLVFVMVRKVDVEGLLKSRIRIDLTACKDEQTAQEKLLAGLLPSGKPNKKPGYPAVKEADPDRREAPAFPGPRLKGETPTPSGPPRDSADDDRPSEEPPPSTPQPPPSLPGPSTAIRYLGILVSLLAIVVTILLDPDARRWLLQQDYSKTSVELADTADFSLRVRLKNEGNRPSTVVSAWISVSKCDSRKFPLVLPEGGVEAPPDNQVVVELEPDVWVRSNICAEKGKRLELVERGSWLLRMQVREFGRENPRTIKLSLTTNETEFLEASFAL